MGLCEWSSALGRCTVTTMGYNSVLLGQDGFGDEVLRSMMQCAAHSEPHHCEAGEQYDVDPCIISGHPLCRADAAASSAPAQAAGGEYKSQFGNNNNGNGAGGSTFRLAGAAAAAAAAVAALLALP